MKEKKNIERLFQENFKDFEVTPHEKNWEAIQNRLDKKEKDRKLIPIWFRYAGVAALLLLFFVLGGKSIFDTENNTPEDKIVIENNIEPSGENTSTEQLNNNIANTNTEENTNTPSNGKDNILEQNAQVANTGQDSEKTNTNNTLFAPQNQNVGNSGVASNKSKSSSEEKSKIGSNSIAQPDNSIAVNQNTTGAKEPLPKNTEEQKKSDIAVSSSKEKEQVALNSTVTGSRNESTVNQKGDTVDGKNPLEKNTLSESGIASTDSSKEEVIDKEKITSLTEIQKDSLTIEEAIAKAQEDKDIDEEEKLVNRWQVYANIAPVYYNTLSDGSHLHEQFVNNPKNGELNTSYGVNVGYALNDKFTVRTGVKSLDLSYTTGNIILYESPGNSSVQSMLRNVTMTNGSISHMAVLSSENFVVQNANRSELFAGFNGTLTQNITYYEVPVEVEYNLINKKIGFQVIGGLSTFFLDNNEIYADMQGSKSYLGEANNINNVSFSANFGLGLDYNFSQKFKFNLEPTFKYQLNAYSNTSGNFRPYIIGVYTGFSYKF